MPEIAPFRGILFDKARIDLTRVLSPVPGAAEATARAAAGWVQQGIAVRDVYKAIYRYSQHFQSQGRTLVRRGVIAAVRLASAADARILSPERTRAEIVDERAALLDATRIQTAHPFALYADAAGEVERLLHTVDGKPPTLDITLADGTRHVLHRIADAELIGKVRRAMMPKKMVLADGHHRYAAALALRDKLGALGAGLSQYASPQYAAVYLCSGADGGLVVRASHRLLHGVESFDRARFLERARDYFVMDPVPGGGKDAALAEAALVDVPGHQPAFVVAFPGEDDALRFTLDAHHNPQQLGAGVHPVVARQAVSVLHGVVFERILGLAPAAHEGGGNVRHTTDAAAALAGLARAQVAFILPAPTPDILLNVTQSGDTLPPRASWLHPPLAPGFVMSPIDPDEDLV
ncbi:MAG TPA: DUF1015 domain-containing protein [Kofleriaceae bacterium]|nr:DUF1015 domain-containing protein [Kofleriaceae bacterium]